jgi:hypothetical protein
MIMRFNTLSRVAGSLAVSAILGSMPAFADDRGDKDDRHRGERAQCSIVSEFVYQSTEFNLPVIDVYGSGFSNKGVTANGLARWGGCRRFHYGIH